MANPTDLRYRGTLEQHLAEVTKEVDNLDAEISKLQEARDLLAEEQANVQDLLRYVAERAEA
jgi:hypothetical protein